MNAVQYVLYYALWWLNLVLKSRQHGITTLCCIYFLDACLFNSNIRAGIVCHKLNDAKRIFKDKIKYAYDNLPIDLKQELFLKKDNEEELELSNNSSIYVGVSMRSGTLQYLHISEYPWLCAHDPLKAKEVKTGAMETIHAGGMIIIEGTAEGASTDFEQMWNFAYDNEKSGNELTRMDYKCHFFPWYKKPENVLYEEVYIEPKMIEYFRKVESVNGDKIDQPHRNWYVKKRNILKSDIFKEHPSTPEEAFHAALVGAYFGHEMIKAKNEGRIGEYRHEKRNKVFTFWDIGSIHTAIWFWQFIQDTIRCIDFYYDNSGKGLTEHIKMLLDKPYIYAEHWCGWDLDPESGSNRKNTVTGNYIKDEAEQLGIKFNILPQYSFNNRIASARDILDKCYFNKETTEVGVSALLNWRQAINRAMSTENNPVYTNKPAPGKENHIGDAFTHGSCAYIDHIYIDGYKIGRTKPDSETSYREHRNRRQESLTAMDC